MAQRAGAQIVEVEASHVVLVSQPERVAEVVATALQAVAGEPATPPSPRSAPPTADRQTS
jgi:hypothetical protein